jgi:hypothetical protein
MKKRTIGIVVLAATLLVIAAVALRGQAGVALTEWLRRMHGQ